MSFTFFLRENYIILKRDDDGTGGGGGGDDDIIIHNVNLSKMLSAPNRCVQLLYILTEMIPEPEPEQQQQQQQDEKQPEITIKLDENFSKKFFNIQNYIDMNETETESSMGKMYDKIDKNTRKKNIKLQKGYKYNYKDALYINNIMSKIKK